MLRPGHFYPSYAELPACRATIRDGRVTLNRWSPSLLGPGPEVSAIKTITAALADLVILDDGGLIVTPVPRVAWDDQAEEALLRWAATAGYRRVWLPARIVDLDQAPGPLATAVTDCPTCGAHWEDG